MRKEGSTVPPCSEENPKSWYCEHYGNALAAEVMITDYIVPNKQSETVKIPNASRSLYSFTVTRDLSPPNDSTPFSLYIYTPSKVYGPLSKVDAGASFYVSAWGLNCDKYCNCDEPFEMPSL